MQTIPASLQAPALQVSRWFNTAAPLTLTQLRGRVVALHAFQMLCPACVSHGLPQALKTQRLFEESDLAVIGLHTVFEHHAVMTAAALEAFIHEYRLTFPIGIDAAARGDPVPLTMRAYGLRGTPSVVLLDRQGRLRLNYFGQIDDMALGGLIGRLIAEPAPAAIGIDPPDAHAEPSSIACDDSGCALR